MGHGDTTGTTRDTTGSTTETPPEQPQRHHRINHRYTTRSTTETPLDQPETTPDQPETPPDQPQPATLFLLRHTDVSVGDMPEYPVAPHGEWGCCTWQWGAGTMHQEVAPTAHGVQAPEGTCHPTQMRYGRDKVVSICGCVNHNFYHMS